MKLQVLFEEKNRLLKSFLEETRNYLERFKQDGHDVELKMDWVDELSDLREANIKALQVLDQQIAIERLLLNNEDIEKLQGQPVFKEILDQTLNFIKEIQLTDQSLFLYIQNMGFELRAQILKGLKDKEAVSKFKSQTQSATGDELDRTV